MATIIQNNEAQNNQTNHETFESFFNQWKIEQENYLDDLYVAILECSSVENEPRCRELVNGVMMLYNHYYEAKARLIRENLFSVLTPFWLTPLERDYLWIGGFPPELAFRLIASNVSDLTEEQSQRINRLMREIKQNEKELSDELHRIQESTVSPTTRTVELAAAHNAESRRRMSMETVAEKADFLRKKTFTALVEILKPLQAVKLLASTIHLQFILRRWGMQREAENQRDAQNHRPEAAA